LGKTGLGNCCIEQETKTCVPTAMSPVHFLQVVFSLVSQNIYLHGFRADQFGAQILRCATCWLKLKYCGIIKLN